jgi:hypothetical protein
MKKALILVLLLSAIAHTAHSQRADSSTLAVFNTARNFTVLSADFGADITQDLIGEMVLATDAIMVLKEHNQVDSSGRSTINTKTIEGNEYYMTYDNEPIDGDNLYRIKLVLNDGTIRYSEEKTVTFHAANGIVLYPNPAHDILNINFKGYTGKAIDITIFDMQGKRLMVKHIDKLQTMDYTLDIPENTAVGQHMILIEAQGQRDVVRLFTVGK